MRFMQRKVEAEESAKKQAKQEAEERARTEKMQWNTSEGISSTDCDDSEMSIGIVIPLNASAADVHGVAAEIVGRRSFGGFNKSVGDTWKEAVESKARERSGAKAERRNISDEELLRRYEKYVKGKADMTEGVFPLLATWKRSARRTRTGEESERDSDRRLCFRG